MKNLLIVWHSRTGAARAMALAALRSAADPGVRVRLAAAAHVERGDMLDADGFLFAAPENLGALSGEMKTFLDRMYYPMLDRLNGRPYGLMIAAGSDGTGAARQLTRIVTGWRLKPIAEPIIMNMHAQTAEQILAEKTPTPEQLRRCEELGAAMAAGLAMGVF